MPTNTTFQILDTVEMPMRDSCVLRADIWLPAGQGPWPVLLQRTPYRKEDAFGTQYISAMDFRAALRRGYAIVVQDTRGRYSSDGTFDPFADEIDDGVDTIAWLRQQDFCDGNIVMFGASYVGATQVLAAAGNPEGLVAISPHLTTGRHGDTWTYRGGAIELAFLLLWIIESLGPTDLARRIAEMPAEASRRARDLLAEFQRDPYAAFSRLPILDDELIALAPYAQDWFSSSRARTASVDRGHLDALAQTRLPFLVTCGWNDLFLEGALELFSLVRHRPGNIADRLVIGPWSHGNPSDWQGDFWHGYAASTAGLSDVQLDFFDAVLNGEIPQTPRVRYFRTGSNTWHNASDWPLPNVQKNRLFIVDEKLEKDPARVDGGRLSFPSDPLNPVPTVGGANFVPGLLLGRNSGAKDQSAVEHREDVLTFTSAPIETDTEVTGLVEAKLWVSSNGVSADWTARLCEVDANGRSIGLVDGIYRQDAASFEPVEVVVRLGHLSHFFPRGSRYRLQIASSNFPRFDRNPQSGVPPSRARQECFVPSLHNVHFGPSTPSSLCFPTVVTCTSDQ
ncbi:CocE/NonD family hydrolase [Devosia sp. BK]|uniref:CocE/NonD family hydrolase n=1 Tax=Devosia sp. BK TaxID=2871706 RepID=UPI00293A9C94|nr:CocE/NonD family hydrolase [Devosia sp. BK]MDV3253756.1 CocE/NonD family hydrolase [Devosia sp. BK]